MTELELDKLILHFEQSNRAEGKSPSDREVKATKIKSQILYKYYQEWKKGATVGNNNGLDILFMETSSPY